MDADTKKGLVKVGLTTAPWRKNRAVFLIHT